MRNYTAANIIDNDGARAGEDQRKRAHKLSAEFPDHLVKAILAHGVEAICGRQLVPELEGLNGW